MGYQLPLTLSHRSESVTRMASCGSIAYVSPDVLKGEGYTNKCDLWKLGVSWDAGAGKHLRG